MFLSGIFLQESVHPMVYAKRGETTSFKSAELVRILLIFVSKLEI